MSDASVFELAISNDTKYLARVREAVQNVIRDSAFPADDVNRIILAVDEAVANIIEHAYSEHANGEKKIHVTLTAAADRFIVTVRDTGKSFNPVDIMAPNMKEHVREGRKSGLGIFLMRKIMDEVNYSFDGTGTNELQMIKLAQSPAAGGVN
jgi:serine/threonine-protein kinase RsbW